MPIYEYQCEACGHKHEALQKFSDSLLTECPACGAHALKKLVSSVAFRLSGSGWYETDFKKKDEQRNLAGDPGGSSEGASQDSGKKSGTDGGDQPASKSSDGDGGRSSAGSSPAGKASDSGQSSADG